MNAKDMIAALQVVADAARVVAERDLLAEQARLLSTENVRLRNALAVYFHAHENGNNVDALTRKQAMEALRHE
jgi:hypothetical protein